jgi:hypothetical protein
MWFEETMGFAEQSPEQVRSLIEFEEGVLRSRVNGVELGCGRLELPRLSELRARAAEQGGGAVGAAESSASTLQEVVADVTELHRDPANAGALFQVASQFNLLEMVGPHVTPEEGVGRYSRDRTQGPACAIACGGGTIYRNYFVPVGDQLGQSAERQIDGLVELQAELESELGEGLWTMRNGYVLASSEGLRAITDLLEGAADSQEREALWDRLRGLLRVGVQHEVQVLGSAQRVTQIYCSALPVSYSKLPVSLWEAFARLVLEAAYEATLRVAREYGAGRPLYLTLLGGGAFGNPSNWIEDAIVRAVRLIPGLDIRIVSYRQPSAGVERILARLG